MDKIGFWTLTTSLFTLLVCLIYYPAISGGWFLDDYYGIVLNDDIKNLSGSFRSLLAPRGLSFFSFAIDYSLWGLNPSFSRMVNVFVHLCNSLLVVAITLEIVGKVRFGLAFTVGAIFLSHPVQSSAVSYVVQRMALLSSLFTLCTILLLCIYFKKSETLSTRSRLLTLCCIAFTCSLAALSKENVVLVPFLVPFVAWLIGYGHLRREWLGATLVCAFAPLVAILIHLSTMESTLGAVSGGNFYQDTGAKFYTTLVDSDFLAIRYLMSQGEVFWIYLKLAFLPLQQALDYCWPIPDMEFRLLPVFTLVVLIGVWVLVFKNRKSYPLSYFGFNWVLIFAAVESSIIPLDPIFEHRLYLPLFGLCLIVFEQIIVRVNDKRSLLALALVALVFYPTLTWKRNRLWGGAEIDFWVNNCVVAPRAPRPQIILAEAYFKDKQFIDAAQIFQQFLVIGDFPEFLRATGESLYFAGKDSEAFDLFSKLSIAVPGDNTREVFSAYVAAEKGQWPLMKELLATSQLGYSDDIRIAWLRATVAEKQGDDLNAAIYSQKILNSWDKPSLKEPNAQGYIAWARVLREESLQRLSAWLDAQKRLMNDDSVAFARQVDFAGQLLLLGLFDQAEEYYLNAVKLAPGAWNLYYNLGIICDKRKALDSAVGYYERALALSPRNILVLGNLAATFTTQKHYRKAIDLYKEITVIQPSNGRWWLGLGQAQELSLNFADAKLSYEFAAQLSGYSLQARQNLKRVNNRLAH